MLDLILYFSVFSLISVGGVNTVMPELYRIAVETEHWVSPAEFTQLFALSQAAPGPNMLIVALVGLKAAGLPGAVAATVATCVPAGALALWVGGLWDRVRDAPWRLMLQRSLLPVVVGLVLASGYVIAAPSGPQWRTLLIVLGSAGLYTFTRAHPLWLLTAGGLLGAVLLG